MENNQNMAGSQQQQYQQPVYQQQPTQFQNNQSAYQQPYPQQPYQAMPMNLNVCPKCGGEMRGKYHGWQICVSILLFPIGLISLACGKYKKCSNCGYKID